MTAQLIDGRARARTLRAQICAEVADLQADTDLVPGLAVVIVGEDPASQIYVREKSRQTEAVGMRSLVHRLETETTEEALLALIEELNTDTSVHGVLVQLPLPPQIDARRVLDRISPEKDVDGFHALNAGRLANRQPGFVPCTPMGCLILLKDQLGTLNGKVAAVVGCSAIVGRPMAQLLLREDCTVLLVHRQTVDAASLVKLADIVVVAAGVPGLILGDWIKPGATVIDVGINRVRDATGAEHVVGDVDFDSVSPVTGAITPVPGGVGPMTIACLLLNTLNACRQQLGLVALSPFAA